MNKKIPFLFAILIIIIVGIGVSLYLTGNLLVKKSISNVILTDSSGSHGELINGYDNVFISPFITISWDSAGLDRVNIYLEGFSQKKDIAIFVPNTGKYDWNWINDFPAIRAYDNAFKIIVSSSDDNSIKAESKSFRLEGAHPADNNI